MKRIIVIFLSLSFMSAILFGCQSNERNGFSNISEVSISKSSGLGKVNSDFFTVFRDKVTLDLFESAIPNAVKVEGMGDIAEPEFDLNVIYKNRDVKGYHLWVGKKGQSSTLMDVTDTHTIYSIPEEITNQLIDLVK